ncbi:MAG: hypothetical protein ABIH28_01460 [archaeon]
MKNKTKKKAMSEVVTAVIMVVLVMSLIAIVWGVISNMVNKELKTTQSCFGNFDRVTINEAYTCYNSSSGEFYFSLNVGDIEIDKILISISSLGSSNSITLNSTSQTLTNPSVTNYPSKTTGVQAPNKNSGRTYIISGYTTIPDSIRVSPIIGGEDCQESDSLTNIETCSNY